MRELFAEAQSWPIAGKFTISRGSKTEAHVLYVSITEGEFLGQGEAVPYTHYGESIEGSLAQVLFIQEKIEAGATRQDLLNLLPPSAARNAVDAALWDLEAKKSGRPVWEVANLPQPQPLTTAYTISFNTAEAMGQQALKNATRPLLKLKLAKADDFDRVQAVRKNAPDSQLIVDANEGWTIDTLENLVPKLKALDVKLIEQPLPASEDDALKGRKYDIPLCADESCRKIQALPDLAQKYQYINVKLDKTGGLTHALDFIGEAQKHNLKLMIGCMVGTSLSMAPAMLLGPLAEFVDLDGPLLLAEDRPNGVKFNHSTLFPIAREFWG